MQSLSDSQIRVLNAVRARPGIGFNDLMRQTKLSPRGLDIVLKALLEMRLLSVEPNKSDKRRKGYFPIPSEAGFEYMKVRYICELVGIMGMIAFFGEERWQSILQEKKKVAANRLPLEVTRYGNKLMSAIASQRASQLYWFLSQGLAPDNAKAHKGFKSTREKHEVIREMEERADHLTKRKEWLKNAFYEPVANLVWEKHSALLRNSQFRVTSKFRE